ncbi:MAG: hypothetical protein ABSE89_08715 [Sedimentisphaerales bacterium]
MFPYIWLPHFLVGPNTYFIFPPIAIIVGIYIAVRWWIYSKLKNGIAIKTGIVTSAIIGIGFICWMLYVIRTSCSSTASIGYIFLPYYTFLVCAATYLISWAVATIILFFCVRTGKIQESKQKKWSIYVALIIIVLFGFWSFKVTARKLLLEKAYGVTSESELVKLYNKAVSREDIDLLAELVKNPNTSEKLLRQIYYSIPESTFKYPGSQYSPVFFQLAKNKKTPSDILEPLSEKREGERIFIATNPNTPIIVLERLSEDKNYMVRLDVCENPNVTREILIKLRNDPEKIVRNYANSHLNLSNHPDK